MSYVRWGENDSDVYVFEDVNGGVTCCGCDDGQNLSAEEMGRHLSWHIAQGDEVPVGVIEAVRIGIERGDIQHPREGIER